MHNKSNALIIIVLQSPAIDTEAPHYVFRAMAQLHDHEIRRTKVVLIRAEITNFITSGAQHRTDLYLAKHQPPFNINSITHKISEHANPDTIIKTTHPRATSYRSS